MSEAELQDAFKFFDTDGSGQISSTELANVMQKLGYTIGPDDIQKILTTIDSDGSGEISFAEFKVFAAAAIAGQ